MILPQSRRTRVVLLPASLAAVLAASDILAQSEAKPAPMSSLPTKTQPGPDISKQKIVGFTPGPQMNEIRPGRFLIDPPTLEDLGFRWYVEGDSNRNASVAVAYRKTGQAEWQGALPMLRIYHEIVDRASTKGNTFRCGNLFAGSVLFLDPGTEYEVRFTLTDPDGGAPAGAKIVTATTRTEPEAFEGGRKIAVMPGQDLMAAYEQAEPGDIILLPAGVYKGPFAFAKSGAPRKPIVFRGPPDGRAILEGDGARKEPYLVTVTGANHLMFENLTFRSAHTAIFCGGAGSDGLTVRRCRIEDVTFGINTGSANARNWFIGHNEIVGINKTWYPRPDSYMSPAHTGVNLYGQGHVVCYNRIARFSDSVAVYNFGPPPDDMTKGSLNIDFYNNDLSWAQDDTYEADYGCHNIRFYRNRCYNAHTGMSAQPLYGGPAYFIRNDVYGLTGKNYKLHNYPAGIIAYNNTTCAAGQGFTGPMFSNGHFRNNLIMGATRYAMETGSLTPYSTLDYNGYRRSAPERFLKWTDHEGNIGRYLSTEEMFKATGLEEHGIQVDFDIFVNASPPEEGKTYAPGDWDVRLHEGDNKAVDAGVALPQITDGFTGKAPDLGCYERGQEIPHYGPMPREQRAR